MMNTQTKIIATMLDTGLSLRPAQWADVRPVAQLILDVCTADGDPTVAVTPEELEREWNSPGFNLEENAWVLETDDGRIVGFEEFNNRHAHASLMGDGYVHPEYVIYEKELRPGREIDEE